MNTLLCRKKKMRGQSQNTTMTQVSSRHGKRASQVLPDSKSTRHSILNKIGLLGILPANENKKESVLWSKFGFKKQNSSKAPDGFDARGLNILVSDPLIEMYHIRPPNKPLRIDNSL